MRMPCSLPRLRRLLADEAGGPAVEWALTLPLLGAILLGGVEVGRLIILDQKMDRVAGTIADLVAQAETLTAVEVDNLLGAAAHIATPFDLGGSGAVIVSSVTAGATGGAKVNWQRKVGGLAQASGVGVPGTAAALPIALAANETVIVAESYYDFRPAFYAAVVPARTMRHLALFRPRLGSLQRLD